MSIKNQSRRALNFIKWLVVPGDYSGVEPNDVVASRKRKTRAVIFITTVIFISMTIFVLLWENSGGSTPLVNDLAVALILNLGVILLIALALLVARNLAKLYIERRGKIAGSMFQTKLVISFLLMTLIPTALLFFVASELIGATVDNWINTKVESTLRESLEVADSLYRQSEEKVRANAAYLSGLAGRRGLLKPESISDLNRVLRQKLREYNVDLIQAYNEDFELIAVAARPKTEASYNLDDKPDILARVAFGETITDFHDLQEGKMVVSLAPVKTDRSSGQAKGVMLVAKQVTKRLIEKAQSITNAFEDYKQLTLKKELIKSSYQVTLAIVALVLLFSAIWIGFYLAKSITVPLKTLSEATEKISKGDLDVKIDLPAGSDEVGQLVSAFNTMTDDLKTTQKRFKQANRDLTESNIELHHWGQYIEAVLDNVAGGVISIDKSGSVTTINDSAARMFGLKPDDARGKNYRKLFDTILLDPIKRMVREIHKMGTDTMEREFNVKLGGELRTLKVNISVLQDHDGQYMGTVFVFDDLTEVIAAQRSIAWREMARVMAHEIKNPLTPIQLNAQRMRLKYAKKTPDFPKVFDDATNTIIQEVDELKKLVDKFTKAAHLADGGQPDTQLKDVKMLELSPEPNMLHDIIYEVLRLYKGTRPGISLLTDLDPSVQLVNIDAGQIKRVFINLVENAIDAINGGGEITIRTKKLAQQEKVQIEVADTGRGVSEEVRKSLFTPYFSTKPDGAGLGLAIVNRVIEDHGGSIEAMENKPKGTVFKIELPIE